MPTTTRSSRKKKEQSKEELDDENDSYSSDVEQQQEQETFSKQNSRELRKRTRDERKSRNMGVGLSISTEATSSSNKIVFDDHDSDNNNDDDELFESTKNDAMEEEVEASDSDDDDAIEEVSGSVARNKAMEELAKERETLKVQKLQTKTKKRKKKSIDEQDDFDEDFFEQLDSEMAEQRKQKKQKDSSAPASAGRHTTFLSTEDEIDDSRPIQTDHNIELVVLGESDEGPIITSILSSNDNKAGLEPSEVSHLFARGRLASGKDQSKIKGTNKKKQNDGWKRSKKMNVLAFGKAKVKRRKGHAASNFVVKSS